jgi:hypothetical protein
MAQPHPSFRPAVTSHVLTAYDFVDSSPSNPGIRQRFWLPPAVMHVEPIAEDARVEKLVNEVNAAALLVRSHEEVSELVSPNGLPIYQTEDVMEQALVAAKLLGFYVLQHSRVSFLTMREKRVLPIAGVYVASSKGDIICAAFNYDIMRIWKNHAIIHPLTHDLNQNGRLQLKAFLDQYIVDIGNSLEIKPRPGLYDFAVDDFWQSRATEQQQRDALHANLIILTLSAMNPLITVPEHAMIRRPEQVDPVIYLPPFERVNSVVEAILDAQSRDPFPVAKSIASELARKGSAPEREPLNLRWKTRGE